MHFLEGIIGYDHVHAELLKAVAEGKFTGLDKFITKKIKLEDVVEEGIKVLMNDKEQSELLSILFCMILTILICLQLKFLSTLDLDDVTK